MRLVVQGRRSPIKTLGGAVRKDMFDFGILVDYNIEYGRSRGKVN